ncbi:MAG: sugar transferase [Bacteroidales bacterium]|nr:sugar transferase [Bacteroidales bacterium]
MNKTLQVAKYVFADLLAAAIAWSLFFTYRKYVVDPYVFSNLQLIYADEKLYLGIAVIPLFWLTLYIIVGTYRKIYRKSRLKELSQTLSITFIGVIFIFFSIILDDIYITYKSYLQSFLVLFVLHFFFTYGFRLLITTNTIHRIHKRIIGFPSIIIGSNGNAVDIYKEIQGEKVSSGNKFVGFVNAKQYDAYRMSEFLPHLGHIDDLKKIIGEHKIEEVIIAIERSEQANIEHIISQLEDSEVVIKMIPNLQDFLTGAVRTEGIWHAPLVKISPDLMPAWQMSLKRIIDIVISAISMLLLLPVYIAVSIGVKMSSKGPVIYKQERVGLHGKPFNMYKFRSMYNDAERGTPKLSSSSDDRITPFGKFLRKVRLDEIPQFYSVFKGDMSLVGPRPERQFFIDQIVQRAPHYRLLHKVKPGITSWGQVKFGYASNVDEMIQRLKYDILYIENMSLAMDLKIMIYTIMIVVQGRGK